VLFCAGGTPSVYAGDEDGLRGVKEEREGGDDAVRPVFPATPGAPTPVFALHQALIGVRRRNAWLHRATTAAPTLATTHAVLVSTDGEHRLSVALNLADEPVSLPAAGELLAGEAQVRYGHAHLGPHGWAVLG
jgi:cyclomaltodextrinase / maltogenic alpha-amylase / neopullulanase